MCMRKLLIYSCWIQAAQIMPKGEKVHAGQRKAAAKETAENGASGNPEQKE